MPRTYVTGVPLAITVNADGTVTLDVDLTEVTCDMETVDHVPEADVERDVDLIERKILALSHVLTHRTA